MTTVKLISFQQPTEYLSKDGIEDALGLVAYCARVSNPSNQLNSETNEKLVKYLIKHQHWSPLEMVNACLEINTTRDIAHQIVRHRSFSFQEFSQRYAKVEKKPDYFDLRRQDHKNRQNSIDDISEETKKKLNNSVRMTLIEIDRCYQNLLNNGIAKECARMILPMNSPTKLYMNGNIRSWIHYLKVRCDPSTQKEHRDIALKIKDIFEKEMPIIYDACFL